jgi:nucleotide-binding universal stress UspA family protein
VAYDGSAPAHRALAHAGEFARAGDRVVVVNVMHEPAVGARIEPPAAQRNAQWRVLDEARRFMAAQGITVETAAPVGDVAAEILTIAAEREADVIVVARHHRKVPHVGGSISARIVHGARCDVLVVYVADTR